MSESTDLNLGSIIVNSILGLAMVAICMRKVWMNAVGAISKAVDLIAPAVTRHVETCALCRIAMRF